MRIAGLSFEAIGERLGITKQGAWDLVHRSLAPVQGRSVEDLRALENERLDLATRRVLTRVMNDDLSTEVMLKAVDAFLRISARRARMNGLDLAADVSVSVSVRQDLDVALKQLEEVIKGEVVDKPSE
jgi:predicted metal-dependent TIM-barrel fold hydrolase